MGDSLKDLYNNLLMSSVMTVDEQNNHYKRLADQPNSAFDIIGPIDEESRTMGITQKEFKTFQKRGVTPTRRAYDYAQDRRAEEVSTGHKWANGITKFVGKTATAVAGATVGAAYGLGAMIGTAARGGNGAKVMESFFDNEFQKAMDNANEWMDDTFRHYYTREEQKLNFWRSMGRANFWANDLLGAMSFTAGAILSELSLAALTAGTAGATAPVLAANTVKTMARGKEVLRALKGAKKLKDVQKAKDIQRITRGFIVGSGYEAGVEARHYKDEALNKWKQKFMQEQGREPTQGEMVEFEHGANVAANFVFAANMALVGSSNAVQFKNIFWKKPKPKLKVDVTPRTEGDKFLTLRGKATPTVDIKAKTPMEKYMLRGRQGWQLVQNPIYEGFVEEGGQSVISKTGTEYVMSKYNTDGTQNAANLITSLHKGFEETYGTSEGMKEVMMGVLIGAIGMPGLSGSWKPGALQGLADFNTQRGLNKKISEAQADLFNQVHFDQVQAQIRGHAAQLAAANAPGENMFDAEVNQVNGTYAFLETRDKLGLLQDTEKEFVEHINEMSNEEFANEFNYKDLSDDQLAEQKEKVVNDFKETVQRVREAREITDGMTELESLNDALAFNIFKLKDLDDKTNKVGRKIGKIIGDVPLNRVKKYMRFKAQLSHPTRQTRETNRQLRNIDKLIDALERNDESTKAARDDLNKQTKLAEEKVELINKAKAAGRKVARGVAGYNFDLKEFDDFIDTIEHFFDAKRRIAEEEGNPINKDELDANLRQLAAYERFRLDLINNHNHLLSEQGQKELKDLEDVALAELLENVGYSAEGTLREQEIERILDMYKNQMAATMSPEALQRLVERMRAEREGTEANVQNPPDDDEQSGDDTTPTPTGSAAQEQAGVDQNVVTQPGVSFDPAIKSHANFTRLFKIPEKTKKWLLNLSYTDLYTLSRAMKIEKIETWVDEQGKPQPFGGMTPAKDTNSGISVKSGLYHENKGLLVSIDPNSIDTSTEDGKKYKARMDEIMANLPDGIVQNGTIPLGPMLDPRRFFRGDQPLKLDEPTVLGSINREHFIRQDGALTKVGERVAQQYQAITQIFEKFIDNKSQDEINAALNTQSGGQEKGLRDLLWLDKNVWFTPTNKEHGDRQSIIEAFPPDVYGLSLNLKDHEPGTFTDVDGNTWPLRDGIYIVDRNFKRGFRIAANGQTVTLQDTALVKSFMESQKLYNERTLLDVFNSKSDNEAALPLFSQYAAIIQVNGKPEIVPVSFPSENADADPSEISDFVTETLEEAETIENKGKQHFSQNIILDGAPLGMTIAIQPGQQVYTEFEVASRIGNNEIPGGVITAHWRFFTSKDKVDQKGKRYGRYYKKALNQIIQLTDPETGEKKLYIWTGQTYGPNGLESAIYENGKINNQKRYEIMRTDLVTNKGNGKVKPLTMGRFRDAVAASLNDRLVWGPMGRQMKQGAQRPLTQAEKDQIKASEIPKEAIRIIKEVDKTKREQGQVPDMGQMKVNVQFDSNISLLAQDWVTKPNGRFPYKPVAGAVNPQGTTTTRAPQQVSDIAGHVASVKDAFYRMANPQTWKQGDVDLVNALIADIQASGKVSEFASAISAEGISIEALQAAQKRDHNNMALRMFQTSTTATPTPTPAPASQTGEITQEEVDAILPPEGAPVTPTPPAPTTLVDQLTPVEEGAIDHVIASGDMALDRFRTIAEDAATRLGYNSLDELVKALDAEVAEKKKDQPPESEYDEAPFSFNTVGAEIVPETLDEARQELMEILPIKTAENPDGIITIEELDIFIDRMTTHNLPVGRMVGAAILLAKERTKGTKFHEAFHIVFRTFLSDDQINTMLEAAKEHWTHTPQDIKHMKRTLSDLGVNLSKLSEQDLINLWYEERLADAFEEYRPGTYKKPKKVNIKWLPKWANDLLTRLLKWIGVLTDNSDIIQETFEDIHLGKYKTARPVNNIYQRERKSDPYKLIKVNKKSIRGGETIEVIPKHISAMVINEITLRLMETGKVIITKEDFKAAARRVAAKYDIQNYSHLEMPDEQMLKFVNDLQQVQDLIRNTSAQDALFDEVKLRLKIYNIKDEEYDEVKKLLEDLEQEMDTETWRLSMYEIGGFMNLSKRMRTYIGLTETTMDQFGLGWDIIDQAEANKPGIFKSVISGYEVYSGIERALAGGLRSELWAKLEAYSQYNRQSKAFMERMLDDIMEQNGLNPDDSTQRKGVKEDLREGLYDKYEDAPILSDFLSSFHKVKGEFWYVRYDASNHGVDEFNSNYRDVDKIQFERWSQQYRHMNVPKNDVIKVLEQISKQVDNFLEPIEKNAETIKNLFHSIGIDLSEAYIIYSLVHNIINPDPNEPNPPGWPSKTTNEQIAQYEQLHANFDYVEPFFANRTLGLLQDKTLLSSTSLGMFVKEEKRKDVEADETGAVNRLMAVARANAVFDESVGSSVFRNAEDKTVFDKINPSYMFEMTNILSRFADELTGINSAASLNAFLKKKGYGMSKYQAEKTWRFWQASGLPLDRDGLEDLKLILHDGLAQRRLKRLDDDSGYYEDNFMGRQKGHSYKKLSPVEAEIYSMVLFDNYEREGQRHKFHKGERYAFFQVGIMESKSTAVSVRMQVREFWNQGNKKLTAFGEKRMLDALRAEYERITEVANETNPVEYDPAYHGPDGRGRKLFMFKNMPAAAEIERAAQNKKSFDEFTTTIESKNEAGETVTRTVTMAELVNEHANNMFQEYLDLLDDKGLIDKAEKKGEYTTNYLPLGYRRKEGKKVATVPTMEGGEVATPDVDMDELSNFFFNDYFNSMSYNMLLHGDMAMSYKSFEDVVKRNGGLIAAGPSLTLGEADIRVASITSLQAKMEIFDELSQTTVIDPSLDKTDAQSVGSVKYIRRMFRSLGKLNKGPKVKVTLADGTRVERQLDINEILTKIERGIPVSSQEARFLDENNASLQPKKIVQRDMYSYIKTSLFTLTRETSSDFTSQYMDGDKIDVDKVNATWESGNVADILAMYKPKPGRETLHNMLNEMMRKDIDMVVFDSAMKMYKPNVAASQTDSQIEAGQGEMMETTFADLEERNIQKLAAHTFREQVNTDGYKKKIIDGTQKIQLVWSEQGANSDDPLSKIKVVIDGVEFNLEDIQSSYLQMLGQRISLAYKALEEAIFQTDSAGNVVFEAKWDTLLENFQRNLDASNADPYIFELFTENLKGEMKYNLNFPAVRTKFMQMYLSYVSSPLSHKAAGRKYTLVSDFGYKKPNGERLQWGKKDEDGNFYAETVVSEKVLHDHGLGRKDLEMDAEGFLTIKGDKAHKLLRQLGVRIPTQDKHSMVVLRIVDLLPSYMGNAILLPHEVVKLSGADFDIDALYSRAFTTYDNGKIYGSYLKTGDLNDAYWEYINDRVENNSTIKRRYNELKKREKEIVAEKTKEAIKSIIGISDKTYEAYQIWTKFAESIPDYDEFDAEEYSLEDDELIYPGENDILTDLIQPVLKERFPDDTAEELEARLETTINRLRTAKRKIKGKELNALKEEAVGFESINDFLKGGRDRTIENNIKAFREGNMHKIRALTVSESNNLLLDMEMILAQNEGILDISRTPASMKIFKEYLFKQIYNAIGLEKSDALTDTNTRTSKMLARESNLVGAFNIGPAALFNVVYQKMIEAGVSSKLGKFDLKAELREGEGKSTRMNDIISSVISAMTDNAKEQIAAELNMSIETITSILTAIATGQPFVSSMLMMKQNAMQKINVAYELRKNRVVKSEEFQGGMDDTILLTHVLNKYFDENLALTEEYRTDTQTVLEPIELTEEVLREATQIELKKKNNEPVTEEEETKWKDVQLATIHRFWKLREVAEDIRAMQRIVGLIKGFPTDWGNYRAKEDMEQLRLNFTMDPSKWKSPADVQFSQSKDDKGIPLNKSLIDFGEMLKPGSPLAVQLGTSLFIERKSEHFFLEKTDTFINITDFTKRNMRVDFEAFPDNKETLTRALISYLTERAYKHLWNTTRDPSKHLEHNLDPTIHSTYQFDEHGNRTSGISPIEQLAEQLGQTEEHKDNFFLKNIKFETFEYKMKSVEGYDIPVDFHSMETNNWSTKDYDYKEKMFYGFHLLQAAARKNPGGPEAQFVSKAKAYLHGTHALMFRSGSFITYIEPKVLLLPNQALTAVHELFKPGRGRKFKFNRSVSMDATWQNVFGDTELNIMRDFAELFSRYTENVTNVRGGRRDFIENIISSEKNNTGPEKTVTFGNEMISGIHPQTGQPILVPGAATITIKPRANTGPKLEGETAKEAEKRNATIKALNARALKYTGLVDRDPFNNIIFPTVVRVDRNVMRMKEASYMRLLDEKKRIWEEIVFNFERGTYEVKQQQMDGTFVTKSVGNYNDNSDYTTQIQKRMASGRWSQATYVAVGELGKRFWMPYAFTVKQIEEFQKTAMERYAKGVAIATEKEAEERARLEKLSMEQIAAEKAAGSQTQQLPTLKPEVQTITGINISSYESGLGQQLTNFANTQIMFRGRLYPSAEAAYQANKVDLSDPAVLNLMTEVITAKLQQHPGLAQEITNRGGMGFLNASRHDLIKGGQVIKTDRWTGQNGLFMQALKKAYQNVMPNTLQGDAITHEDGSVQDSQLTNSMEQSWLNALNQNTEIAPGGPPVVPQAADPNAPLTLAEQDAAAEAALHIWDTMSIEEINETMQSMGIDLSNPDDLADESDLICK